MEKGAIYKHYKGNLYRIIDIAIHSESLEQVVVYECLYENPKGKIWVRPLKMWNELIDWNGKKVPRFAKEKGE